MDDDIHHLGQAGAVTTANGGRGEAQAFSHHGVVGHLQHGQHSQHDLAIGLAALTGLGLQGLLVLLELRSTCPGSSDRSVPCRLLSTFVDRHGAATDASQGGGEVGLAAARETTVLVIPPFSAPRPGGVGRRHRYPVRRSPVARPALLSRVMLFSGLLSLSSVCSNVAMRIAFSLSSPARV